MKKVTTKRSSNPVEHDPEVLAFRAQFDGRSPLDEIIRTGAQQMLQTAIEAEVCEFLLEHSDRCDEQGRRLVVRNGYLPERELLTGVGRLEVSQPRGQKGDTHPIGKRVMAKGKREKGDTHPIAPCCDRRIACANVRAVSLKKMGGLVFL